ncbi:MAG: hypothetical protein KDD94_04980, partial [Calditrichaeota bacterium]|nr:hypothetical protein [Calditrichota bacterium]
MKAKIYAEDEGIPSGQISAVNEGKDGLLWVAHGKGISHYDGISWYTFADTLNLPRVQTRLEVSENNTIWVLGRGVFDLIFARYRSNQWQQLNIPQLRDNLTLSAFDSYANTDRFIISDSESIYMFNSDSGAWRPFNLPSGILVADLKRIKFIDHKLFLFFNDRVLRYDYLNNQVELISDQVSTPLDMIKLESRYIILAVNQLLSVYNQKKTVILENFLAGNQLNLGELHSNQNRLFFRSANFLHMYDLDSKNYYQLKTSFYGSQFQVSTLFF